MMSPKFGPKSEGLIRTKVDNRAACADFTTGSATATGAVSIVELADIPCEELSAGASASTDIWSDWPNRLVRTYPELFGPLSQKAAKGRLQECGTGRGEIVERMCARINAVLTERERFHFERVGDRNGALRVYWGGKLSAKSEAAIRGAIDLAEARSLCFCEHCGLEGRLYRDGEALATRCDHHAQGERVSVRLEFKNLHLTQKMTAARQWMVVIRRYDPQSDTFIDPDPADAEER
jgi:hypothetical protein